MPDNNTSLAASSALGGLTLNIGKVTLTEVVDRALVSIAFQPASRDHVSSVLQQGLGSALPEVGKCSTTNDGATLLGLQLDQAWLSLTHTHSAMDKRVAAQLQDAKGIYLTDQSDGWTALSLSGDDTQAVLERLCPLDIALAQFPVNTVSRTAIEHSGVILVRTDAMAFELITPRSSVASFVHAIESVAHHIHNERALQQSHRSTAHGDNNSI